MAEGSGDCLDEGEKYFNLLNQMFVQDPEIEEIDIVHYVQCKINQDGSAIICEKHKLAIQLWCMKPLYMYAYNRLLKQRKRKSYTNSLSATDTLQLSRAILLLNAECYTVWNIRKELVMSGVLNIDDDLQLSSLVLSKNPRSAETFSHRKWLINLYVKQKGKTKYVQDWLRKELCVCLYCADHYPDNYVAWTYRGWITKQFIDSKEKYLSEMQVAEKWIEMHISDHCGFHFRQQLLKKLKELSSVDEMIMLLLEELVFVTNLQNSFPGHEATWYHRRFIIEHWNLWFGSMSNSYLKEVVTLSNKTNHQESSRNVTCVHSLSFLCRSALNVKSMHGKPLESLIDDEGDPLGYSLIESELEYCGQVEKKSKISARFSSSYKNWLIIRYGKKSDSENMK